MVKHRRSASGQGRAKKSKAASEYDADAALSLKESIETGQLGHGELLKLVEANQEPCQLYNKTCKGRRDNPNCLCGLVPAPEGFRRKALWQKEPEAIVSLGYDPTDLKRESTSVPSGLNNLGNTCYVNAALQGLFMIRGFREGLFAVEEPIAEMPVVSHIRRLFAELQEGPKTSTDPTSFAESLNLDRSVQQDGQEFFKLLLTLLETKLRGSVTKVVRELVPSLFRGTYFYETRCQTCGCLSEGSKRATNFYELEAQVKGASSLEESLARLLSAEHLQGDNKFHCAFCESKVDATRQIRLHCIPPVLCLSLQRFVFDMKKLSKVKATDKLSMPLKLDVASILAMAGAQPLQNGTYQDAQYELMSILIHKGPSASHGHYVAHVWDAGARKWWRCDDETVTEMPKGPVAERGDHGVAAEKKAGAAASTGKGKRKPKGLSAEDDPDIIEVTVAGAAAEPDMDTPVQSAPEEASGPPAAADRLVSSNAYMLIYRRCNWSSSPGSGPVQLPQSLTSVLESERQEFEAACAKYKQERQALMDKVQARRDLVRRVVEAGVLPAADSPARWVPADWLTQWANSTDNVPFPKDALLCKDHGKLDPNKVTDARRITPEAFQMLQQQVEGCEALQDADLCVQCLVLRMQGFADAHQGTQQRGEILKILEAMEEEPDEALWRPGPEDFYVSKSWLQGWRRRMGKTMSDQSPTQGITCPHGSLLPELAGARPRRAAVPPVVWRHLQAAWRQACIEKQAKPKKAPRQKSPAQAGASPGGDASDRDRRLHEREAAVALREQRVGGMDSDLLATFGDQANSNSSASKEERYQAREAILEMRENAVAAKEEQALTEEAAHASSAGQACPIGGAAELLPDGSIAGGSGPEQAHATTPPDTAKQSAAHSDCNGHAQPLVDDGDGEGDVVIMTDTNGHTGDQTWDTLTEFSIGHSEECPICIHEFSQDMSTGQHLREQAGTEKGLLAQLAANTAVHLEPGSRYALLPRPWLATWRAYIGASGKRSNMADVKRPGALPEAVAETYCACHAFLPEEPEKPVHLNVQPPSVVKRRGRWMQNAMDDDAYELVNLADWEHLMAFYAVESSLPSCHPARRPIEAVLEIDRPAAAAPTAAPAEPAQHEEAQHLSDEILMSDLGKPLNAVPSARGADESARGHLATQPSLCQQAVSERACAMRAAQLSYTDALIHVEIVQASDLEKAPAAPTGERRSKRARREEAEVKVSSCNTLWDFKLRLVEALNIHPKNADVHIRLGSAWQKLTNDEASLAELGLGQGQEVKVVHAGLVSDDDFASIVGGPHIPGTGGRAVERGFAGTALADIPYSVLSDCQ